jgi:hypothetical protein
MASCAPRRDPALGLLSDTMEPKQADVGPLAGKSTLNRLVHGPLSGASRYHKAGVDGAASRPRSGAGIAKGHAMETMGREREKGLLEGNTRYRAGLEPHFSVIDIFHDCAETDRRGRSA